MAGTLYGIGVGPGDPELLTLKAARLVREAPVIAVPVAKPGGESYAWDVVCGLVRPEQRVLRLLFPMLKYPADRQGHREAAAAAIAAELDAGSDVAFLTEGDPLLHSTFIHVLECLPPGPEVVAVPGVTSISAAAAQATVPLASGDQRLAVLPATSENLDALPDILRLFDTVVLLKFSSAFEHLYGLLARLGLCGSAIVVERASHPAGRVIRDLSSLRGKPIHYLSLLIVRCERGQAHA